MKGNLKIHFVEIIATIILVALYSLLFVPVVLYFDFVQPIHILWFSGGIVVLNLIYGTIHTWWKHRGKYMPEENAEHAYEHLEELSNDFNSRTPRLVIFKSDVPNAYATDTLPTRPIIALTDSLIDKLEPHELKAVIAHEMSHIKSYDVFFMLFLSSFVNIVEYAHSVTTDFIQKADDAGETLIALPFFIITYINITIVYAVLFFVSRVREYTADKDAARATSPESMSRALQNISSTVQDAPEPQKQQLQNQSALCIVPLEDLSSKLFKTHPTTKNRVKRLQSMNESQLDPITTDQTNQNRDTEQTDDKTDTVDEQDEENTQDTTIEEESENTTETAEQTNTNTAQNIVEETETTSSEDTETKDSTGTLGDVTEDIDVDSSDENTETAETEEKNETGTTENPSTPDDLRDLSEIREFDESIADNTEEESNHERDTDETTTDDNTDESEDDTEEDDVEYPTDLSLRNDDL